MHTRCSGKRRAASPAFSSHDPRKNKVRAAKTRAPVGELKSGTTTTLKAGGMAWSIRRFTLRSGAGASGGSLLALCLEVQRERLGFLQPL